VDLTFIAKELSEIELDFINRVQDYYCCYEKIPGEKIGLKDVISGS